MENSKVEKMFVLDSSEVKLEKPTHEVEISTVETRDKAIVDVGFVDARENGPDGNPIGRTIIYPLSYDARLIDTKSASSVEIPRLQVIAETCKARVIGIGQPDVTVVEDVKEMPFLRQVENVFNRYSWSAEQMLEAMNKIVDFKQDEHVEILGYVESAAIAAAMAKELSSPNSDRKLVIDRMMMVEPMNDQPRSFKDITTLPNQEVSQGHHHFADNSKFDWLNGPTDLELEAKNDRLRKKQSRTVLMGGAAMGMRPFSPVLVDAIKMDEKDETSGISEARFDFLKFKDSSISRIESIRETADDILRASKFGSVAIHIAMAAEGQKPLRMEAFQSMPNVKRLFKGPLA